MRMRMRGMRSWNLEPEAEDGEQPPPEKAFNAFRPEEDERINKQGGVEV